MHDYILEIARYLYRDNPNVDIDEIAAIAGIKATHILDYFPSNAALHAALDEKARRSVENLVGKVIAVPTGPDPTTPPCSDCIGPANARQVGEQMPPGPGTTYVGRYVTADEDCAHKAGSGREWSNKPPVVASCAIIRICEELCMIALQQSMPEGNCSLGIRQQLDHLGPVAVGAEIEITARCTRHQGRYSSWQIIVRNAHEIVGQGCMDFMVVHRPDYDARRLGPKYAALAVNSPSRPSTVPAPHLESI